MTRLVARGVLTEPRPVVVFVGRSYELALLQDAIRASSWPFQVLHLWGVGGIGKSTLLDAYERLAVAADMPFRRLDCRDLAPNPKDFTAAWNAHAVDLPDACRVGRQRWILALDTYEAIAPLDRWMRESFLPSLPSTCLVILSGRLKPEGIWATDAGWRALSHSLELAPFDLSEVTELLTARAVPPSAYEAIFRLSSGHPLAAELVAAQVEADPQWDPGAASAGPSLLGGLVDRFLDEAPSPVHREALEIASIALVTNQDLLADLLPRADAYQLVRWLGGLSWMRPTERGFVPHDLARDAIFGDLRRRSPHQFHALRVRIHDALARRASFARRDGLALRELTFLQRTNPMLGPFLEVVKSGEHWVEPGTQDDHAAVIAMTRLHEGAASAELLARWLVACPEGLWVTRSFASAVTGFAFEIRVTGGRPDGIGGDGVGGDGVGGDGIAVDDPAMTRFRRATAAHAPLGPGETGMFIRTWMAAHAHQRIGPEQTALFFHLVQLYLTLPGLAFSAMSYANPDEWRVINTFSNMFRLPEGSYTFDAGGAAHPHAMYYHDWRKTSPMDWLALLGRRDGAGHAEASPGAALFVGPDGRWFQESGKERVDLAARKILSGLLWRLASARRDRPGEAVSLAELLQTGWPDERPTFHSGRHRVYVAISSLRKRGLEAFLTSNEAGYLIDPAFETVFVG